MANAHGHSHVRGAGYYAKLDRICQECKHVESVHFGACTRCACDKFCARKLDRTERAVLRAEKKRKSAKDKGVQYQGEAWLNDFVSDFGKKKIDGVDS